MGSDIGVIAPYAAQVTLLSRLLTMDVKFQRRFQARLGDYRAMQLAGIEVKTVDGFEGREKEVIIFSTVRNNSGGYIGFLSDRRRLNVGLTRAKRGLFVVGSSRTLASANTGERKAKLASVTAQSAFPVVSHSAHQPASEPVAEKRSRKSGAWVRYIKWLQERGMILPLGGERIRRMAAYEPSSYDFSLSDLDVR
jgi:hypothetical protein